MLSQREGFLRDKIDILKFLRKEEIECEIEPTITEEDIKNAEKQLQEYLESIPKETKKVVTNILMDV